MLFGKSCVSFIAGNTLFILRNRLREVFEYPVLKVVTLRQIALLQHFELGYLNVQVHLFLKTLIACGKHFDLRKRQGNLVHIFGRTDGAFTRHYLGDKFLFALHELIEISVKGLLGYIAVNLNLWEHISLSFDTPLPLFKVAWSPRTVQIMNGDKPILNIRACAHFLSRA